MVSKRRNKKRVNRGQALAAAEAVVPAMVRSFLQAGLTPEALSEIFNHTLACIHEPAASPGADRRQDLADLAHVLSVWHADARFVDNEGHPRPLRRAGRKPNFEELASFASPGVPTDKVLTGLFIAGAVEFDTRDRIRPLQRELLTRHWDELGLWNWQQAVRRLLETLEFNYTMPGIARFERSARSERLPARLLPIFDRWMRQHAEEFLRSADDWLTQHEEPVDLRGGDDQVTTGVGVYMFIDEPSSQPR